MIFDTRGALGRGGRRALLAATVFAVGAGVAWAKPAHKSGPPSVNIAGTLQTVTGVLPDPKHPTKPLWKLLARSADVGPSEANNYDVVLRGVAATLYRNGVPQAYLTAPRAVGDQRTRTVTATGGVFIKSLTDRGPYGRSTLTADRVQWQADKNTITALGHVVYHDGTYGGTLRSPVWQGNTSLHTLHATGAGRMVLPRGL